MHELIQLSDDLIIGKGRDRICYEHPAIHEQCIKISKKSDKQSKREMHYFSFLKNKNTDLSKISTFLGVVETNKGLGYAFDLIRDNDGNVSKTLLQSLNTKEFTIQDIKLQLSNLKEYLITNKICVRDISPSNISCQKTLGNINLFIIDGVSNANANPLTIRFQRLINASIDKAWKGLDRKLARIESSLIKE
jgi:serine/threonine protein kinase